VPLTAFKCCKDHEPKPFDECIRSCREGNCLYPLHLLARIPQKLTERENIPHDFSATALTMCPRAFALEDRLDYAEHPQDFIARDRGDSHHKWIDDSGPFEGVSQETRVFKMYNVLDDPEDAFELSGKADWVDTVLHEIGDHKTTGWTPKQPYDSHEAQVNVYADLWDGGIDEAGNRYYETFGKLWIEYFDGRSYSKHEVRSWSPEERKAFIEERGTELVRTRRDPNYLPPRLDEHPKDMRCKYCPVRDECEELSS
jgi:hypothetical protein